MSLLAFWARALFAILFICITYLILTPDPAIVGRGLALTRWISAVVFHGAVSHDKIEHYLAFTALGATAFPAQIKLFNSSISTPIALALYGGLLEIAQGVSDARSPELADAAADALGAASGYAISNLLLSFFLRRAA